MGTKHYISDIYREFENDLVYESIGFITLFGVEIDLDKVQFLIQSGKYSQVFESWCRKEFIGQDEDGRYYRQS